MAATSSHPQERLEVPAMSVYTVTTLEYTCNRCQRAEKYATERLAADAGWTRVVVLDNTINSGPTYALCSSHASELWLFLRGGAVEKVVRP